MDGTQAGAGTRGGPGRPAGSLQVTILLSTYNGAKHLESQLNSFLAQAHVDWRLVWRDDGSLDASCATVEAFADAAGKSRCIKSPSSGQHLGAAASFLRLLNDCAESPFIAFADQDDCWLPAKLQRALLMLADAGTQPAIYCARQILTDEDFGHPCPSMKFSGNPGFPASLTQNIATGGTVVMNNAAARLVAAIALPEASNHDWWSYLVVSACGGKVVYDAVPSMLYRQHAGNMVGSQISTFRRAIAALGRGPGIYMTMMRRHADRLWEFRDALDPRAVADLQLIRQGLAGGLAERIAALRCPGFKRGTALETLLFRLWFLAR